MGMLTLTTPKSHYESFPSSPFPITCYFSILVQPCWEKTLHRAAIAAIHCRGVSGIKKSLDKEKENRRPEGGARSNECVSHP